MESIGAWFCMIHNMVNAKLDKPQYNCETWMDQWRPDDCTSCHLSDTSDGEKKSSSMKRPAKKQELEKMKKIKIFPSIEKNRVKSILAPEVKSMSSS